MRWGVLARADDRGLGNQTWEVVRNYHPDRVLVVRLPSSERQGFRPHLERFPGATVVTCEEASWRLPERQVREWLAGLDVVWTAETFYDWRLVEWADDQGVATVCHTNPEYHQHHLRDHPHPTAWWAPTDWRLGNLPAPATVVPMPVPTDRFTPTLGDGSTSVLHIGGRPTTGDRNGTNVVAEIAAERRYDITITTQAHQGKMRGARVVPATNDYWSLYPGHAVLLLPRRYGGLCLPVLEACAAGLVPVLPACSPNEHWPAVHIPCTPGPPVRLPAGLIDTVDVTPDATQAALDATLRDLSGLRARAVDWAARHSYEALRPLWMAELAKVADRSAPRPRSRVPKASVVVPFAPTDDHRIANWRWLRRRLSVLHDVEIIEAPGDYPWIKADAVADGIRRAAHELVVVMDADVVIDPRTLNRAIAAVDAGAPWVMPHYQVHRLTEDETAAVLTQDPSSEVSARGRHLERDPFPGCVGGGIVVTTKTAWERAPMDPRFVGWGYEDASWGMALNTLAGTCERLQADLVHLWHPEQPSRPRRQEASAALWKDYQKANGVPARMSRVVAGGPASAPPLDRPVEFRSSRRRIRVGDQVLRVKLGRLFITDPDLADELRARDDVEEVA